ncbi:transcription factor MYB1R1 [Cucumis melo var. makuwa]|uniref:Transcription factor MYB1R1 n=1 Tax=Cucumis melo var. makuwa TaxID=1194695 RepID=A0A5A7ULN5_CUCMM|nr:transcription factor MYB1R1 [Cucumis melo var. makuwa]
MFMPMPAPGDAVMDAAGVTKEFMLFGVRVVVDPMRKSVSMNNLSQYEHPLEASIDDNSRNSKTTVSAADRKEDSAAGYASADDAVPNSGGNRERERKRGVPWTEEEHKLFLLGLQKVGKGDWRGISRNFVKTRTPTQVASHAQKYFLRRSNLNRRRRRSSLFDITTDTVKEAAEEEQIQVQDNSSQLQSLLPPPPPETCNINVYHPMIPTFPLSVCPAIIPIPIPMETDTSHEFNLETDTSSIGAEVLPLSGTTLEFNLNSKSTLNSGALSLNLALPSDSSNSSMKHSAFQGMSSISNGDNIISVA